MRRRHGKRALLEGSHPKRHLAQFRGVLQADAFAGFNTLYENGGIREAACWAQGLNPEAYPAPRPGADL
jgi:hypothetical protein